MNVVLLRVGIDTGCGGILSPIFEDGTFEYIPIPDGMSIHKYTYGSIIGRKGLPLSEYFPKTSKFRQIAHQSVHFDPEFETFTYGDPTAPKSSLKDLQEGDLLVFYAGLQGYGFRKDPALYIIGYFEVAKVQVGATQIGTAFQNNIHVHPQIFLPISDKLVLIKGNRNSKLLEKAVVISVKGKDSDNKPLHVLSPAMQKVFGDFDGKIGIQRSPPRWVFPEYIDSAAKFVRSLE